MQRNKPGAAIPLPRELQRLSKLDGRRSAGAVCAGLRRVPRQSYGRGRCDVAVLEPCKRYISSEELSAGAGRFRRRGARR
jgi:hypothetical protein